MERKRKRLRQGKSRQEEEEEAEADEEEEVHRPHHVNKQKHHFSHELNPSSEDEKRHISKRLDTHTSASDDDPAVKATPRKRLRVPAAAVIDISSDEESLAMTIQKRSSVKRKSQRRARNASISSSSIDSDEESLARTIQKNRSSSKQKRSKERRQSRSLASLDESSSSEDDDEEEEEGEGEDEDEEDEYEHDELEEDEDDDVMWFPEEFESTTLFCEPCDEMVSRDNFSAREQRNPKYGPSFRFCLKHHYGDQERIYQRYIRTLAAGKQENRQKDVEDQQYRAQHFEHESEHHTLPYGRYKGKLYQYVLDSDPQYCNQLIKRLHSILAQHNYSIYDLKQIRQIREGHHGFMEDENNEVLNDREKESLKFVEWLDQAGFIIESERE